MIPRDVLKKIRAIHLRTNYLVNDVFAGEYESAFRGRGMEFDEVREYTPGDDIRTIDWNVTARFGHPYVKVFREERELTIMLLVDVSSSTAFGTGGRLKQELSAEIASVLAFAATKSNDKVGLIMFSDHIEKYIPPQKGKNHVWRVIRDVLTHRPAAGGTDIAGAIQYLSRVTRRRVSAFLISDFIADGYDRALRTAGKRHDIVAVCLTDARELELPPVGIVELQDAETGEVVLVDCSHGPTRSTWARAARQSLQARFDLLRASGIDCIDIRTDAAYIDPLLKFFRMREKKR